MEESLSLNREIERVGFGKRLGSSLLDFTISLLPDDNCISNTQFNIDVFENSKLHIRLYFMPI